MTISITPRPDAPAAPKPITTAAINTLPIGRTIRPSCWRCSVPRPYDSNGCSEVAYSTDTAISATTVINRARYAGVPVTSANTRAASATVNAAITTRNSRRFRRACHNGIRAASN